MDNLQWLLNISYGLVSFLGGWIFTRLFTMMDRQEQTIKDINDKTFTDFITLRKEVEAESRKNQLDIADLALKVSTTYVTKDSFDYSLTKIEDKLDINFSIIQDHLINKK